MPAPPQVEALRRLRLVVEVADVLLQLGRELPKLLRKVGEVAELVAHDGGIDGSMFGRLASVVEKRLDLAGGADPCLEHLVVEVIFGAVGAVLPWSRKPSTTSGRARLADGE